VKKGVSVIGSVIYTSRECKIRDVKRMIISINSIFQGIIMNNSIDDSTYHLIEEFYNKIWRGEK